MIMSNDHLRKEMVLFMRTKGVGPLLRVVRSALDELKSPEHAKKQAHDDAHRVYEDFDLFVNSWF